MPFVTYQSEIIFKGLKTCFWRVQRNNHYHKLLANLVTVNDSILEYNLVSIKFLICINFDPASSSLEINFRNINTSIQNSTVYIQQSLPQHYFVKGKH